MTAKITTAMLTPSEMGSVWNAMQDSMVTVITLGSVRGVLCSVEREDGSGRCFNVVLAVPGGVKETVFVRVVDIVNTLHPKRV